MAVLSILFDRPDDRIAAQHAPVPAFFRDLNLDQVVDALVAEWAEYDLKPLFCMPLRRVDAVAYRHQVFQDLENPNVLTEVRAFAQTMRDVRAHLRYATADHGYRHEQNGWFLDAVEFYCAAIRRLTAALQAAPLRSSALLAMRDHLAAYSVSATFTSLEHEMKGLKSRLASVRYCVIVKPGSFTVRRYEGETDYSAEVEATFDKFKQGAVQSYLVEYKKSYGLNHIEAIILDFVARLFPEIFHEVDDFRVRRSDFLDETLVVLDRESHFYMAYIDYMSRLGDAGLPFCYPHVSAKSKDVHADDAFDLALAQKLVAAKTPIVCNGFYLIGAERIIVVSGPNQGGKTTFARMFGQLHYLASLGCPVPGHRAQLFLADAILTHFEREESVRTLRGKLEDDLVRIRAIIDRATPQSIIIMNEIFTSTTLEDEIFLSKKVMQKITARDLLCVWVTFIDELASFGPQTVSMVSTVDPSNPALRTLKIVRRPADGLAYAMAIAQKYRLTADAIRERIRA